MTGSIPNSLTEGGKAFIASSTTRLASATSRRSSDRHIQIPASPAFNRQYPFVDVLLSDITESGEMLDGSELARAAGAFASKA